MIQFTTIKHMHMPIMHHADRVHLTEETDGIHGESARASMWLCSCWASCGSVSPLSQVPT